MAVNTDSIFIRASDIETCGRVSFLSCSSVSSISSEESLETENNPKPLNSTPLPRNWKHSSTTDNTVFLNARGRSATLPLPHFSAATSSASGTFYFQNDQKRVNLQVISSFATSEEENDQTNDVKVHQKRSMVSSGIGTILSHSMGSDDESSAMAAAAENKSMSKYFSLPGKWDQLAHTSGQRTNPITNNMRVKSATLPLPRFSKSTASASGTFHLTDPDRQMNLQVISSFATSASEGAESDRESDKGADVRVGSKAVVHKGSYKLRYKTGATTCKKDNTIPNGYRQPIVEQRLVKSLALPGSYNNSTLPYSSESVDENENSMPESGGNCDTPDGGTSLTGKHNNVNNTETRELNEDEPIRGRTKKVDQRVRRARKAGMALQTRRDSIEQNKCTCLKVPDCRVIKTLSTPTSLQFAQYSGFRMMPSFFFPALPKLVEDIWVILQLIVVFFDFLFNCITYDGKRLSIIMVSLSTIALLLALLDGIIYFTQGGSLASCVLYIHRKVLKHKVCDEEQPTDEEHEKRQCCQFIPNRWKHKLNTWFELIRTLLSEVILYPLALVDLVELIQFQTFSNSDVDSRINFGLFIISLFYLIISIYVMRIIMTISIIVNLRRIPKQTDNNYTHLVIKFCVHLVGQLVVHATILVMNSVKVLHETCVISESNRNSSDGQVTILGPFLWYTTVSGYVLPFLGILLFLLLNYPALKMFSIAFYIDIISTVINDNLGDVMFKRGTLQRTKQKAQDLTGKINISSLKSEFKEYFEMFTLRGRVFYRLTNPWTLLGAILYTLLIVSFLLAHISGPTDVCDRNQGLEIILFKDTAITVTFFIGVIFTFIANYHAILIFLALCAIIFLLMLFVFLIPVLALAATPVLLVTTIVYCLYSRFYSRH